MIKSWTKIGRLLGGSNSASQLEIRRTLTLLEHESMRLLQRAGIPVPNFDVASNEAEAYEIAQRLGGKGLTVKAEVSEFIGDRTKIMFDSGLRGCVHFVFNPNEAKYVASKMIGLPLRTGYGKDEISSTCRQVLVRRRCYARKKASVGIKVDPDQNGPVIYGCKTGIAVQQNPCSVLKIPIDIENGLTREDAYTMARALDFKKPTIIADLLMQLYGLFIRLDCQLLEILSLIEDISGKISCYDCNIVLDDDARFRQTAVSPTDTRWHMDQSLDFNGHYSDTRANIGCIVNGSGLGMASMDSVDLNGGHMAKCVEIGGGGRRIDSDELMDVLKSMMNDKKIHAIFINIFDTHSTDDIMIKGILDAINDYTPMTLGSIPIILRLHGAGNINIMNRLLGNVLTPIFACDDFDEAMKLAVKLANNVAVQRKLQACQSYAPVEELIEETSSSLPNVFSHLLSKNGNRAVLST